MSPIQRRRLPAKTSQQMPDYGLNGAINRIQATAEQSAATAQQIEERMIERANGRWEEQGIIEED